MNHKLPPLPVRIVIGLVILSTLLYYAFRSLTVEASGELKASGTIESVVVNVSPEMPGKVMEVLVDEGQFVRMGDPLLSLDASLLAAQKAVAQSGVDSARSALLTAQSAYAMAQAQYDAALTAARAQQGAARLTDWSNRTPNWFEQPLWYFSQDEQIQAAQAEVESARQALDQAEAQLEGVIQELDSSVFVEAEAQLSSARMGYLIAKSVHDHAQVTGGKVSPEDVRVDLPPFAPSYRIRIGIAKTLSGDSDILAASQNALDAADAELDAAQQAYDDLLTSDAAERVLEARAALSVAQERYEVAMDTFSRLQTGENSPQALISAEAVNQAKAHLKQAESAVRQAEANLALLDTQIAKLTVYAPADGTVLMRNIQPGEFVQPGSVALTLANLNELTITVYVPENRLNEIKLGQHAGVTIDVVSGDSPIFDAEIVHISDQAEFTPRNVQTVEGRSSTVFAVKLKVTDTAGRLKIGMPADVIFK
ncbi:MAG TPA: efflux RND transporter periplasmic adaptor subunit [Anaerolineales bacterium]|nr:efflux RND transporter periplasmic adaptor subunit [Anaerolineales bacterium]